MDMIDTKREGPRFTVTMARPDVHNAMNAEVIERLTAAFVEASETSARYVVLRGEGRSFSAGADLNWMRAKAGASREENEADAARLCAMLDAIVRCPKPVVARVHGAALGGGMGLVVACDLAVAAPRAKFGLTEARLGILPAMIMPYLLRKVARHRLLEAALRSQRFDASEALQLGLVNAIDDDLDGVIERWAADFCAGGPDALASVKRLFATLPDVNFETQKAKAIAAIATARVSEEGQEGMAAFLEKRAAAWIGDEASA